MGTGVGTDTGTGTGSSKCGTALASSSARVTVSWATSRSPASMPAALWAKIQCSGSKVGCDGVERPEDGDSVGAQQQFGLLKDVIEDLP